MKLPAPGLLRFYAAVALLTLFDNAVVTAIIWLSLSVTSSSVPLGLVLCLSIALPFAFEQWVAKRQWSLSMGQLAWLRVAVFAALAAFSAAGADQHLAGFLMLALAVGMVDFLTVSVFESRNAELVVEGRISANHAARLSQTAVQLGGFGGAFLGGALLQVMGGAGFLVAIGIASTVATLLMRLPRLAASASREAAPEDAPGPAAGPQGDQQTRTLRLGCNRVTALLIGVAVVGSHIGGFNSMLPLSYREVNGWDATAFGLASAVAGFGAFLAAGMSSLPAGRIAVAVLLVAADALLVFGGSVPVSCGAAFMLGFVTNLLRINLREQLMASAVTTADAAWIGSRSAYAALSMQAASPLVLSLLASGWLLSAAASRWLMVGCGVVVLAGMLGIDLLFRTPHATGEVRGGRPSDGSV